MAYLSLQGINKIYPNGFHAVHDFNLDIEQGEFICLVGPSGCGKSTTLRMIAGLENISKGDFLIGGVRANEKSPREREIAMVFQSYALYPHMSVYDNLAFGLSLQGVDDDIIEEKVQNIARILGLTDYLDRKPRALSGGQRQRVAVGRAIIRKVGVFLMDEPLSNLDAKQRVTMRSEITDIHRKVGSTTIYVTHDQTEAMTMADRIVVMKDGYIQQVGTPYDLYFEPINMFVAGFIGEPPMNFVSTEVEDSYASVLGSNIDLRHIISDETIDEYQRKPVVIGFRPEGIVLGEQENSYVFTAEVVLTELLGDNTNVYVQVGDDSLILKVDPHDTPEIDTEITFSVPYANTYIFDKETELVIAKKGEEKPTSIYYVPLRKPVFEEEPVEQEPAKVIKPKTGKSAHKKLLVAAAALLCVIAVSITGLLSSTRGIFYSSADSSDGLATSSVMFAGKVVPVHSEFFGTPVTQIGSGTFAGSDVQNVIIPDTVTKICSDAFDGCASIADIAIPGGATIESNAFKGCTSLTGVTIKDGAAVIEANAFAGCTSLENVSIPSDIKSISRYSFDGCTKLVYSKYEGGLYLGNAENPYVAFIKANADDITSIEIHPDTKVIAADAFADCKNLVSINYKSTSADWDKISLGENWNKNTGNYEIICSDKTLSK